MGKRYIKYNIGYEFDRKNLKLFFIIDDEYFFEIIIVNFDIFEVFEEDDVRMFNIVKRSIWIWLVVIMKLLILN